MNIKDAIDELAHTLQAGFQDLDLMYEDDADVELSTKNEEVFNKLQQAITAWMKTLEDQIESQIHPVSRDYLDQDAWLYDDEEFANELNDLDVWVDGDLDEWKGKPL